MYVIYDLFQGDYWTTFVYGRIEYPDNLECNDSVWMIPNTIYV
jgi:hypothetical protein